MQKEIFLFVFTIIYYISRDAVFVDFIFYTDISSTQSCARLEKSMNFLVPNNRAARLLMFQFARLICILGGDLKGTW